MRASSALTFGFEAFRNSGGTATIDKVDLADPHGIKLLAAYAVPITGGHLYGVQRGYPHGGVPEGVQWSRRQRADGATVPHSRGPTTPPTWSS